MEIKLLNHQFIMFIHGVIYQVCSPSFSSVNEFIEFLFMKFSNILKVISNLFDNVDVLN